MTGTIIWIDKNGMFKVRTEDGDISTIELLDFIDLEVGDVVSGNLDSLAGETLKHLKSGDDFEVFIQDILG